MTLQPPDEQTSPAATAFAYDVFVVHAAADEPFLLGYLLPNLGLSPERVLRSQTLELGQVITDEIERGVQSSRVTLVVLSSACMDDRWASFGQQLAAYASVAKRTHGVLLPLLLEDCTLTVHADSLVKLDFRDPSREVWEAQVDRLRVYLERRIVPVPDLPSPYPGMRPFTEGDAGRFFGRDAELDRIVRWLRSGEREIYIIGASGSGKSSLIAAGLVPLLTRGVDGLRSFRVKTFRPGERPKDRLVAMLVDDPDAPSTTTDASARGEPAAAPLLLVIDQLEELFAVVSDGQRREFLSTLRSLQSDPNCVLVFALRADFYGSFMDSSLWTDRDGQISRIDLGPLRRDSLQVIIERPARELDVYFQPELVSRLLDDAAREPGALPLLQETLFQLWARRRQRLLALADYRGLSDGARTGLAFAVKEHADDVFRKLTSSQKAIAFRILLRLVNFGEGRADTRRQQPRDALRSDGELGSDFEAVLQSLVSNRLLTVTGDEQHRDVRVDLAHEILIQAWTTFADWIQAWSTHEQRRRELEAAAAAWRVRGSNDGGLLDPVEFASARAWQDKAGRQLGHTADLAAFLLASETAHSRAIRQRRRSRLVGQIALVASALALGAFFYAKSVLEQRNQRNRLLAESAQLYQDVGWQRLIESKRPLRALPYLVTAGEAMETSGGELSQSLRTLFAAATRNLPVSPSFPHQGRVLSTGFSSKGSLIVATSWNSTARLWNTATGNSLSLPSQPQEVVLNAAFSTDGTRVITISSNNTLHIWDAATGKLLSSSSQHPGTVRSAAFSSSGSRVVTVSWHNTVCVWDAITGKLLSPPLQYPGTVSSAVVGPDGTVVVIFGNDKIAHIWDAALGKDLSRPLTHLGDVVGAAFSPDGTHIVTTSQDKTARIWEVATGKPLSPPLQHQGTVQSAAFSLDGTRVITASDDETARIWDAATGEPLSLPLEHQEAVRSVAFSPDGSQVATSGDDTTRIWDAGTSGALPSPLEHRDIVWSVAFNGDGTRVVTASGDRTARVWDPATSKPVSPPLQHQDVVRTAVFSRDGTRVVTASDDRTARVWDAATGEPLSPSLPHHGIVVTAAFSFDGARVFTASVDSAPDVSYGFAGNTLSSVLLRRHATARVALGPDDTHASIVTMCIWDAATGELLSSPLQRPEEVLSATLSFDGARLVTTSGNSARVWDTSTGNPLSPPLEHHGTVVSATFTSDATRVVTASGDNTARIWDAATGKAVSPPLEHQSWVVTAAFSPDGSRVVTGSLDKTARVWDAATGSPLSPPLEHQDSVLSVGFSPDGTCVITGSSDKTARVWDATTGKPLSPPLKHQGIVRSAVFSSDGTRIVTASEDKTTQIWNLPLAPGTLRQWRALMDRVDPYVLVNGVLIPRTATNEPRVLRHY